MNYEEYDDLNHAKSKILKLLQTKYSEQINEYQDVGNSDADSQMNQIVTLLNNANGSLFQMLTFVKNTNDTFKMEYQDNQAPVLNQDGSQKIRNGVPVTRIDAVPVLIPQTGQMHFRNVNSYITFNQYVLSVRNGLKNLNRIFETLINDIDSVKPTTMQLFKEAVEEYKTRYNQYLAKTTRTGGDFAVVINFKTDMYEKSNLQAEITEMGEETIKLNEFTTKVLSSYNFSGTESHNKRDNDKPTSSKPIKFNQYGDGDDEE